MTKKDLEYMVAYKTSFLYYLKVMKVETLSLDNRGSKIYIPT